MSYLYKGNYKQQNEMGGTKMKKREITKIVHSLMVAGLAACLLAGCGNAKTESSSVTAVEETTDAEAATESEAAENEAAEEQSDASAEASNEENSSTETTDTDTTDSSDEAEEAESDTTAEATDTASSDPGEVTYITDFTSIDDYMGSLDSEKPAIVIYNQQEGYLINMQEGQHYQLKAEDKILFNFENGIGYGLDFEIGNTFEPRNGYVVYLADYSKISEDKKFFLDKKLEDGSIVGVSCYLAPPVEQ